MISLSMAARRYTLLGMVFSSLLLIANVLGPKLFELGPFILPVSIFFFPLTYLIAAIITELYGFQATRRIIYWALLMNIVMVLCFQIAIHIPPSANWTMQVAYATVLGGSSRVIVASLISYLLSELLNGWLMKQFKQSYQSKNFSQRAILSIMLSEAMGTALLMILAFAGIMPWAAWAKLLVGYYFIKISYIAVLTPIADQWVSYLQHAAVKSETTC